MADAAISLLVNRLAQVVEENATLILGIRDHVEELVSDLNSFQAILKQASKHESSNDNDVLRDVVDKIRSVVNEAEDAIDKYLVDTRKHKSKGTVMRYLDKVAYYSKASDAAKQIDAIKGRVAKIRQDHDSGLRELQRDPNEAQLFLQRKESVAPQKLPEPWGSSPVQSVQTTAALPSTTPITTTVARPTRRRRAVADPQPRIDR